MLRGEIDVLERCAFFWGENGALIDLLATPKVTRAHTIKGCITFGLANGNVTRQKRGRQVRWIIITVTALSKMILRKFQLVVRYGTDMSLSNTRNKRNRRSFIKASL